MITIAEAVQNILKKHPFIEEALAEGIINYTALARKLKPEIEEVLVKEIQIGAIVMAIKRLVPTITHRYSQSITRAIQAMEDIIIRSNLVEYTFKHSSSLIENRQKLLKSIQNQAEVFHTSTKGVYETNIITSISISDTVSKIFATEELLKKIDGLSSITIRLSASNIDTPGIYYYILKELAWANINIIELVSTTNEFTLILNEQDISPTFSLLQKLIKRK